MNISELVEKAHDNAVNKGFWDLEKSIFDKLSDSDILTGPEMLAIQNAFSSQRLMLIVSELAEAQEALRKHDIKNYHEELADVVIRLGDMSGGEDVSLENEIIKKMDKNKTRGYLHGKAF